MERYILAIDQGTTNSRAIIFTSEGLLVSQFELPLKQSFPQDGWVEQDPMEMVSNTIACCQQAMKKISLSANNISAIGISNQRETTIIWDRATGKPIYPAIVWQDRRTTLLCEKFRKGPLAFTIQEKTGLMIDPYFSATKIVWILENIIDAKHRANKGELAFGTVDTFLLWHLTKGKSHLTDATNASRTMLFNIKTQDWDDSLLDFFSIPRKLLPQVLDCSADFGVTEKNIFGAEVSIAGIAGDQQAATVGQACFEKGMVKTTYGTGGFMVLNTGNTLVHSKNKLLSTIAYRINNEVTYALEGSIFCAGATIKWLRDNLKIIKTATETETLAEKVKDTDGVYLIPAFTGLGAPYWDPNARAAIVGITRNTSVEHIARAALEAVAYQTKDLLEAMIKDYNVKLEVMRVDGGMVQNKWLLQFIADILLLPIERPNCIETSALGAAYLAGLQKGIYTSLQDIEQKWRSNLKVKNNFAEKSVDNLYQGWKNHIQKFLN